MDPIGRKRWAATFRAGGTGADPALASHETACLLNSSDDDAHVEITLFFSDREPAGPYEPGTSGSLRDHGARQTHPPCD